MAADIYIRLCEEQRDLIDRALRAWKRQLQLDAEKVLPVNRAGIQELADRALVLAGQIADAKAPELGEIINHYAEIQKREEPGLGAYIDGVEWDDELEDAGGFVSPGADPGAWVLAWVWCTDEQAGIEEDDEESEDRPGPTYDEGNAIGGDNRSEDC